MKFLCVPCDHPMDLSETRGPFEGTMTIVYVCPSCGQSTAMLTNRMETQMVRSLGVRIGGRTDAAAPMEMVRNRLQDQRGAPRKSGSACPFTGVVTEAFGAPRLSWTEEAESRIARIPAFARPAVKQHIEEYAAEHNLAEVDAAVIDQVKGRMGF